MLEKNSVKKSRYINLYLPLDLVEKIDSIAFKEERSRNFTIKKILEKHLGRKEADLGRASTGLMKKSRYINLYLPLDLVEKIDSIAFKEERSRNFTIKKIL